MNVTIRKIVTGIIYWATLKMNCQTILVILVVTCKQATRVHVTCPSCIIPEPKARGERYKLHVAENNDNSH